MTSKLASWRTFCAGIVVAAGIVATSGGTASGASTAKVNGVWPLVGKICGPGPGGASSVRGVGTKSIHIAVFNDAAYSGEPGLEIEFVQAAQAFSAWCNASGGIDGRRIVISNQDAGLFNSAQVTSDACQSDFMAVGGGMVLDQQATAVRVACGLGQISAYDVSNQAVAAPLQVNPEGLNLHLLSAGWMGALAKAYPGPVKKAGIGATNVASVIEAYKKLQVAGQAQGWTFGSFQIPPLVVDDWTPYIQQLQTQGVQALVPSTDANITPYVQAMNTAGYHPSFMLLGQQFYDAQTLKAAGTSSFPPTYVSLGVWPFELASKSPGMTQLLALMHTYARGDTVDSFDDEAFDAWVLWAKSATACGSHLTVSCVLAQAATEKNWSAGDIAAPVKQLAFSNDNPRPSPCFVLMKVQGTKFVYDKSVTKPTNAIWNCNPSGVVTMPASLSGS